MHFEGDNYLQIRLYVCFTERMLPLVCPFFETEGQETFEPLLKGSTPIPYRYIDSHHFQLLCPIQ